MWKLLKFWQGEISSILSIYLSHLVNEIEFLFMWENHVHEKWYVSWIWVVMSYDNVFTFEVAPRRDQLSQLRNQQWICQNTNHEHADPGVENFITLSIFSPTRDANTLFWTLPWASNGHVTTQLMSPQRLRYSMLTITTKRLLTGANGQMEDGAFSVPMLLCIS